MADMKVYSLIGFEYDGVLYPVETCSVNPACQQMLNGGGASVSPTIAALLSTKPIVSFGTAALATVLAKFGQAFLIESETPVVLYFGKRVTGGTFGGAGTVVILTINAGALFLKGMTAKQDGTALANYDVYATFDGTNLPLVYSVLDAPTDAILEEKFTLGPVKFSALIEVQGVDWDTGYEIMHESNSGSPYPLIAGIRKQEPTVTIETFDLTQLVTTTMIGCEVSSMKLFFQKFSSATGRVAANVAEHVSVTFAKAHIVPGTIDGPWRGDAALKIIARPRYDGTSAVAVISTATVIS